MIFYLFLLDSMQSLQGEYFAIFSQEGTNDE